MTIWYSINKLAADIDGNGTLVCFPSMFILSNRLRSTYSDSCFPLNHQFKSFEEFQKVARVPSLFAELGVKNRDSRGLVQVNPSTENYFGEELRKHAQLPSATTADPRKCAKTSAGNEHTNIRDAMLT